MSGVVVSDELPIHWVPTFNKLTGGGIQGYAAGSAQLGVPASLMAKVGDDARNTVA